MLSLPFLALLIHPTQGLRIPGVNVPGWISQACVPSRFSRVGLFATPWTLTRQSLLSMGFFRREFWSGFPCPPPGDLPDPGIKPATLKSVLAGGVFATSANVAQNPHTAPCFLPCQARALRLTFSPFPFVHWPSLVPAASAPVWSLWASK